MMRTKIYLITAVMVAAMTSCGPIRYTPTEGEALTKKWAGKEYKDIVKSYNTPDRIEKNGSEGTILVYEDITSVSECETKTCDTAYGPKVTTTTTTRRHRQYTNFFLDRKGSCYMVKTNRRIPACEMEKHEIKDFWVLVGTGFAAVFTVPILVTAALAII